MRLLGVAMCVGAAVSLAAAQPAAAPPPVRETEAAARRLIEKGARYLIAAQDEEGGWASQRGPGVTALCAKALIQTPDVGTDHPAVRRAVAFVLKHQRDDGGIYSAEGMLKNYESSVALSMLSALGVERHRNRIDRLQAFLIANQWDESEDIARDNPWYGGAGYGSGKRPDLSNTQMMLDALHDSGLPKDHPAYKKALVFIQRCQMLGESNDQPYARGSTDGGFIYSPANLGESKAGQVETGGREELRTYGSMTYAGFKSMLYAGLTRDDPRVRAALDWIGRHWTLDYNPNMPEAQSKQGLFYYYHTFGRALAAWGEDVVRDKLGREHRWREELVAKLAALQSQDGSWVNEADRWMEGLPALTTAYSMLALQAAFPPRSD
ncbi:MAG TPA: terpene cyclase/mutase family protein [Phycisphaerae bacterium]|nr:terpene cyclase/mutase family protein [Phycisphaerae bacterium]